MPAPTRPLQPRAPNESAGRFRPQRNLARVWRECRGAYVADLRVEAGMTQTELANAVGLENKQVISGIETGGRGIPPERSAAFAEALGVDRAGFAKKTLRWDNPWCYADIYGADAVLEAELAEVAERINVRRGPRPRDDK